MLEMNDQSENYPKKIKEAKFWDHVESLTDPDADGTDIAIGLASAGYYCCELHIISEIGKNFIW